MKTDPTKENTNIILYDINKHRINDNYNLRSQNIILYIIYNIIIRVIIKSLSQIRDLIKNLRIIEPNLLKSSNQGNHFIIIIGFYHNPRLSIKYLI